MAQKHNLALKRDRVQAELEHIKKCLTLPLLHWHRGYYKRPSPRWPEDGRQHEPQRSTSTECVMISALAWGRYTSYRSLSGANVWHLTVTHCTTSPSTRLDTTKQAFNSHPLLDLQTKSDWTFAKRCRNPSQSWILILDLILISHIFGAKLLLLDDELMWNWV